MAKAGAGDEAYQVKNPGRCGQPLQGLQLSQFLPWTRLDECGAVGWRMSERRSVG